MNLANGFWAAPEGSIEVAKHWQEWLGSIRTRDLREASLVLVATGPTDRPGVLDGDNQALLRRVDALYWGLLAAAPLHIHGQPMRVTGANVEGEIEIRGSSNMNATFHVPGLPSAPPPLRSSGVPPRSAWVSSISWRFPTCAA